MCKTISNKLGYTLAGVLALVCAWTTSGQAANIITVTNVEDCGMGSLREALARAADGDTIDASSVSGTIVLTTGELLVTTSVTILGPGPPHSGRGRQLNRPRVSRHLEYRRPH